MKAILVAMATVLASLSMGAQQNISFREGKLVSPQVNNDRTVTFRVNAPKAWLWCHWLTGSKMAVKAL